MSLSSGRKSFWKIFLWLFKFQHRSRELVNLIFFENQVFILTYFFKSSDLIREGCPAVPEPPLARYPPHPWTEFKEAPAIEAGFRKFVRRAKPTSEEDEIAVVVCHANVIRYFMCRGLQDIAFKMNQLLKIYILWKVSLTSALSDGTREFI